MGLYSSFSTSQYYDDTTSIKKEQQNKPTQPIQKPHTPVISEQKRKSLYDEAIKIASTESEYTGPDFRDIYRVGQLVTIKGPNGQIRTNNGKIVEIVARNLMYVYMQDTYKDVTGQWLADFVTDKDTIIPLQY